MSPICFKLKKLLIFFSKLLRSNVDCTRTEIRAISYLRFFTMEIILLLECNKAINNGTACSVLFSSTTFLFPASGKISEQDTQSSVLTLF